MKQGKTNSKSLHKDIGVCAWFDDSSLPVKFNSEGISQVAAISHVSHK